MKVMHSLSVIQSFAVINHNNSGIVYFFHYFKIKSDFPNCYNTKPHLEIMEYK